MKLSLKLANVTHTFEVTGSVSVKYSNEGIEIIEDITDTVVSAPVVQQHYVEPKNVSIYKPRISVALPSLSLIDLVDIINRTSVDNDILHVRKLLKPYLSDAKFNDIISALNIYVRAIQTNSGVTDWGKRIRSLMVSSMFILSGFTLRRAINLLNGHPISKCIPRGVYSNLKTGAKSTGYVIIAEHLWPELLRAYEKKRWRKAQRGNEIQKFQQIVDALKYGYSYTSVAKFADMSPTTIYRIQRNDHLANKYVEYDGIYPIGSDVYLSPRAKAIDVRVCKKCNCIIPVKDVLDNPCTELCVNCKNKKEKTQIS